MLADQLLRDLGLHRGQELGLMHLRDSSPACQTELFEVLDSNSRPSPGMVRRLEKPGLVERAPDPRDGRHPGGRGRQILTAAEWEPPNSVH